MYRTYNTKVKLLGLNPTLNYLKILGFYQKPHIFWSTAPISIIFSADESWMHALSTQASEKSVWLFSLFGFCRFLAVALIYILRRGCILIVSKIDLTWPNQPGPCGTLWSSHYNNISHVVMMMAGGGLYLVMTIWVFTPKTSGVLVSLCIFLVSICSFYFIFLGGEYRLCTVRTILKSSC